MRSYKYNLIFLFGILSYFYLFYKIINDNFSIILPTYFAILIFGYLIFGKNIFIYNFITICIDFLYNFNKNKLEGLEETKNTKKNKEFENSYSKGRDNIDKAFNENFDNNKIDDALTNKKQSLENNL